jgi:hypothetical protein
MVWRSIVAFVKDHKSPILLNLLAAAGIVCAHSYYSRTSMTLVLVAANLVLLLDNRLALSLISVALTYSVVDSLTKRLGGYYFHEIPLEILDIVFDSNYDEATNLA